MSAEFISLAYSAGVVVSHLVPDGRIRRVPTLSHPTKRNGAAVWHGDHGVAWNWETGERVTWSDRGRSSASLSPAERAERERVRRLALVQEQRIRERGRHECALLMRTAQQREHDYLVAKQLPHPHGLVARPDVAEELGICPPDVPCLLVPMRSRDTGQLCGVQRIYREDDAWTKRMIRGSVAADAVLRIGPRNRPRVYVEGYATGLSVVAACPAVEVVVCFSAGNLERVARAEGRQVDCVFADHDASGRGEQAARVAGLRWCMSSTQGWDASDVWMRRGGWAVSSLVMRACAGGAIG